MFCTSHLIACSTAGFVQFSVMSAAEDAAIFVEVDQVDQHLLAYRADEARWMP